MCARLCVVFNNKTTKQNNKTSRKEVFLRHSQRKERERDGERKGCTFQLGAFSVATGGVAEADGPGSLSFSV